MRVLFQNIACECNGWSGRCRYVEDFFLETGDGGECLDCDGHRAGQHCENCKENAYPSKIPDEQGRTPCVDCKCDTTGKHISLPPYPNNNQKLYIVPLTVYIKYKFNVQDQ